MTNFIKIDWLFWENEEEKTVKSLPVFINVEAIICLEPVVTKEDNIEMESNAYLSLIDGGYYVKQTCQEIMQRIDIAVGKPIA